MEQLTDEGRRIVDDVARRHGFSSDAVTTMLIAVSAGYGNQAQFNHPEFGGMGQWSSGGMIMIGDMFNNYLKGRIASLCQELSGLIQGQPLFAMPAQSQNQSQGGGYQQQGNGGVTGSSFFVPNAQSGNWWPTDLGVPGSTGAQNNLRYAYFPATRRLAIDVGGQVSVYDTGNHQIGGFSQQQSGDQSITFTSQFGLVRVLDLPLITSAYPTNGAASPTQSYASIREPALVAPMAPIIAPEPAPAVSPLVRDAVAPLSSVGRDAGAVAAGAPDEIFSLIEKLADLHKKGILTDSEYESKKGELLGRL
ncbi:SHOCT domain-containing protein [Hyphomicrobium sp.]|jgi:hypothetical protein|uniref:SHOCT domain-containing protein n=1 Tax=Hyphomicrobium sp. TaxID=82 RepID=UPI0035696639